MKNVIEYDEQIIGYKNDLIEFLKEECNRLRKDDSLGLEELESVLKDYLGLIEELNKKTNEFQLYGVCPSVMGDLTIKNVYLEIEY